MPSSYSSFELAAWDIYTKLKRSHKAFLKKAYWYFTMKPEQRYRYETIPQMGANLSQYGHKDLGRTQSKKIFKDLRQLPIFDLHRLGPELPYDIRLNEIGKILGGWIYNNTDPTALNIKTDPPYVENRPTIPPKTDPLRKDIFNNKKDLLIGKQEPTPVDNFVASEVGFTKRIEEKTPERIYAENFLQKLREGLAQKGCNYTNTSQSNDVRIQPVLDRYPAGIWVEAIREFEASNLDSVRDQEAYLERICERITIREYGHRGLKVTKTAEEFIRDYENYDPIKGIQRTSQPLPTDEIASKATYFEQMRKILG